MTEEENSLQPELSEDEEEEECFSDDYFEVEAIIDHQEITDSHNISKYEYKILWKGYPMEQSSWEKESNLQCHKLLKNYKKSQGIVCRRGRPKGSKNKKPNERASNNKTSGQRAKRTFASKKKANDYNHDEEFKPCIKYDNLLSSLPTNELPQHAEAPVDLYTRVKQRRADAENASLSSGPGSRKASTSSFGDVATTNKDSKRKKKKELPGEENIKTTNATSKTSNKNRQEEERDDDDMNGVGKFSSPTCDGEVESDEEMPATPYGVGIQLTTEEIEANFSEDDCSKDAEKDSEGKNSDGDHDEESSDDNEEQPPLMLASPAETSESESEDDRMEEDSAETTTRSDDVTGTVQVKEEPAEVKPKCKYARCNAAIKTEVLDEIIKKEVVDGVSAPPDIAELDLPPPFDSPFFVDPEATPISQALEAAPAPSEALEATSAPSEALEAASAPSEALEAAPTPSEALEAAPTPSEVPEAAPAPSENQNKTAKTKEDKGPVNIAPQSREVAAPSGSEARKDSNEERSAFDFLLTSMSSPADDPEPMTSSLPTTRDQGGGGAFSLFKNYFSEKEGKSLTTAGGVGDDDGRIRLNDIRKKGGKKRVEQSKKVEDKINVPETVKPPSIGDLKAPDNKKSGPATVADREIMMGTAIRDPRKRKLSHDEGKERGEGSAIISSSRVRVDGGSRRKETQCNQKVETKELVSELPSMSRNKITSSCKRTTESVYDPRLKRSFSSARRSDEKKIDGSSGRQKIDVHKSWKNRAKPSAAASGRRSSGSRSAVVDTTSVKQQEYSAHNNSAETDATDTSQSEDFSPRRRRDPYVESISILKKLLDGKELDESERFHVDNNKEFFEEKVDLKLTRANASKIKGFFEQVDAKEGPCLAFHHPGSIQIRVGERKDSNENFRKYIKENNVEKLKEALSSLDMYNLEHEGESFLTPLQIASINGFNEIAEILCYAGANVNLKNRNSQTPLIVAIDKGHEVIVRTLFKYGATLNDVAKNGETALYKAVKRGSYNIMKFLLTHGADVFSVSQDPVSRDPYIKPCIDTYVSYKQSASEGIMKCIDEAMKKLRLRKIESQQGGHTVLLMKGFSIRETFQLSFSFNYERERYARAIPLMFTVHTIHDEENFVMKCRLNNECSVYGAFLNKAIMEPMYPESNTSNTYMVTYLDCRHGQNHLQLLVDQNSHSREVIYVVVCLVKCPKM